MFTAKVGLQGPICQSNSSRAIPITDDKSSARRFEVDLAFLSHQAALLYETQLSQVRAQLRNANRPSSTFSTSALGGSTGLQDQVSGIMLLIAKRIV